MANFTTVGSKLNLKLKTGEQAGKVTYRTLSLSKIDPNATAAQLSALKNAIGSVLAHPIVEAVKVNSDLIEE